MIDILFFSLGWVNTLLGCQKQGAKGFMFFTVTVDLTEEGIGKFILHSSIQSILSFVFICL